MIGFKRPNSTIYGIWLLPIFLMEVVFSGSEAKHYHSFAGPFRIITKRMERCPPDVESKMQMHYNISQVPTRHYESPTYDGGITMPYTLTNALSVRVLVASWSNMGGWKDNAHIGNFPNLCSSAESYMPYLWRSICMSVFGESLSCPFLPGIYRFQNWTISYKDCPVKQLFYGRWRSDMVMINPKKEVIACVRGYFETVPK